jgi:hypothetical protein
MGICFYYRLVLFVTGGGRFQLFATPVFYDGVIPFYHLLQDGWE